MSNDKALIKRQVVRIIRTGTRDVKSNPIFLPDQKIFFSETVLLKRLNVPELHALADVLEYAIKRAGATNAR